MKFEEAKSIKSVAIVGTGVIGSGWAARYLANGLHVRATDPAPGAEDRLRRDVDRAWPAITRMGLKAGADRSNLTFTARLGDAVQSADYIQENAPEDEALKARLMAEIDAVAPEQVIIASSSSGLLPSRIQANCRHPERVVIGHPFNPVYLMPLVEVLGGQATRPSALDIAFDFYRGIGMSPLRVRQEIPGYIADRLQEALWREALHLINDGIATTKDIDEAISNGPGVRWAFMGTCLTFHLAGGDGGMAHTLAQFAPALKLPWTKLVAPELTEELSRRLIEGTAEQAKGQSVESLVLQRDNRIVDIMIARDKGASQATHSRG